MKTMIRILQKVFDTVKAVIDGAYPSYIDKIIYFLHTAQTSIIKMNRRLYKLSTKI